MLSNIISLLMIGLVSGSLLGNLFWWIGERKICYGKYGCFTTGHPFTNTEGLLPQSPDTLNVRLLLYTRANRQEAIDVTDIVGTSFNPENDIKIIIHGYYNTVDESWVTDMKNAFLTKEDLNVFVLDWAHAAGNLFYPQSIANSRLVAAIVADFIKRLQNNHNVDAAAVHLIGFSLGAHLSGYIGSAVPGLGRITGLDPAGPSFDGKHKSVRLDGTDAEFVDVIHTDADKLINAEMSPGFGAKQQMGDVDFYVNGGSDQPGCPNNGHEHLLNIFRDYRENFGCSHYRALHVFIESINNSCMFKSCPCAMDMLDGGTCKQCSDEGCNNLGMNVLREHVGVFYTNTTSESPFCLT